MKTDSRERAIIILLAIMGVIIIALIFIEYLNFHEIKTINSRINNLESDLNNTKEVLDANGFEDLNL